MSTAYKCARYNSKGRYSQPNVYNDETHGAAKFNVLNFVRMNNKIIKTPPLEGNHNCENVLVFSLHSTRLEWWKAVFYEPFQKFAFLRRNNENLIFNCRRCLEIRRRCVNKIPFKGGVVKFYGLSRSHSVKLVYKNISRSYLLLQFLGARWNNQFVFWSKSSTITLKNALRLMTWRSPNVETGVIQRVDGSCRTRPGAYCSVNCTIKPIVPLIIYHLLFSIG